jgi:cytidine deaminase
MNPLTPELEQQLTQAALAARNMAYAPYSRYQVGAALLIDSPDAEPATPLIFTGCNVENTTYGLTVCAERTAILKAVSEGYRSFRAIAVATEGDVPGCPCGLCLQTMAEFAPDLDIILITPTAGPEHTRLLELLTRPFRLQP